MAQPLTACADSMVFGVSAGIQYVAINPAMSTTMYALVSLVMRYFNHSLWCAYTSIGILVFKMLEVFFHLSVFFYF